MHYSLRLAGTEFNRARCKWARLLDTAFEMEDNLANAKRGRATGAGRFESDLVMAFVWGGWPAWARRLPA